jgi:ABC-2 type transport system permease protein
VNLWRLELLRLTRTHRWLLVFGIYLFFAVVGPLTARYFNAIIERFGGDEFSIVMPDPRPVDGLLQFLDNGGLFGLLALVVIGAGALALDARPEIAAFLRTRTDRPARLIVPRYLVTLAAGVGALALGTIVTWIMTASLLGRLPLGPVVLGTLLGSLYLAFAVAIVAAVAGFVRTQVAAVFVTFAVLLALPALGMIGVLRPWMPSELLYAGVALVEGATFGEFVRAAAVAAVASLALLGLAARRFELREL